MLGTGRNGFVCEDSCGISETSVWLLECLMGLVFLATDVLRLKTSLGRSNFLDWETTSNLILCDIYAVFVGVAKELVYIFIS